MFFVALDFLGNAFGTSSDMKKEGGQSGILITFQKIYILFLPASFERLKEVKGVPKLKIVENTSIAKFLCDSYTKNEREVNSFSLLWSPSDTKP